MEHPQETIVAWEEHALTTQRGPAPAENQTSLTFFAVWQHAA